MHLIDTNIKIGIIIMFLATQCFPWYKAFFIYIACCWEYNNNSVKDHHLSE